MEYSPAIAMLETYTSPVTFLPSPAGFPSFLGMARLGNIDCCYFTAQYPPPTSLPTDPIDCSFELSTLKLPKGFRLLTYSVKDGVVTLNAPSEMVDPDFKMPLLLDLVEGTQTSPHNHICDKNHGLAGRNGCPKSVMLHGRRSDRTQDTNNFILFADGSASTIEFCYFLFMYPTQTPIFHKVPYNKVKNLIKVDWKPTWDNATDQSKVMLDLAAEIHFDDDMEILWTEDDNRNRVTNVLKEVKKS